MIKLFNALRFKLLSSNKFSKYLLYALGEIVLVVVGILIALQINNTNQKEIQRDKEVKLLNELENDLQITSEELARDVIYLNRQIEKGDELISFYTDSIFFAKSVNATKFDFNSYSHNVKSYPRTMAYQNLKSLGVDLFSNDSIRFLMTEIFERKLARLEHWQNAIINREESLFTNHSAHLKIVKLAGEENWYDLIPKDFERSKENMSFINEFTVMQDQRYVLKFILIELKSEIIHLLKMIENNPV